MRGHVFALLTAAIDPVLHVGIASQARFGAVAVCAACAFSCDHRQAEPPVAASSSGPATTSAGAAAAHLDTAAASGATPPPEWSGASSKAARASPSARVLGPDRKPGELPGRTIDYPYDARDVKDRSRAYEGRAFVHDAAAAATEPLPLVVFLHGLNRELTPHRWMGGGNEGDVRRIVADLIERGALPAVILAGPGSVAPAAVSHGASFPVFDFDRFLELTEAALAGVARIDRSRVVVTGHSGAGCSERGGLVAAARAKSIPLAVVSIDTCMAAPLASALGGAAAGTHVVVTWQTASWKRDFDGFRKVFAREMAAHPAGPGVLRELDPLPALPRAHDATVAQTLEKWLPRILPGRR